MSDAAQQRRAQEIGAAKEKLVSAVRMLQSILPQGSEVYVRATRSSVTVELSDGAHGDRDPSHPLT